MTGHNVKHAVHLLLDSEFWGMWSADNNIKNNHGSTWFEAYFVGIVTNCGSYLLANRDQIYKVSTFKAQIEDESFSALILEAVEVEYQ